MLPRVSMLTSRVPAEDFVALQPSLSPYLKRQPRSELAFDCLLHCALSQNSPNQSHWCLMLHILTAYKRLKPDRRNRQAKQHTFPKLTSNKN